MLFNLCEINTEVVSKSLDILWQGLIAVVIGIGVIIAVTYVMLFFSPAAFSSDNTISSKC